VTGPNVTAVIPVYEHEHAVPHVVAALRAHGLPIVLVDDGSGQSCRGALEILSRETGATLVRLPVNGGKGAAVIAGLRAAAAAGFTHALQVDADGQHTLADTPRFLEAAAREPEVIVCGRPVFDASIPRTRFFFRYLTHALVWLQTLSLSEIRDSMCGFRLYPIHTVLRVVDEDGVGTRMDFDVEILVKLVWRGHALRWLDTRVSYPLDGISHFRMLLDNVRLARMHVRLTLGMLWRAPRLLYRRIGARRSGA
jgi:glycosyltransferase involved in cell wall biosynthesis